MTHRPSVELPHVGGAEPDVVDLGGGVERRRPDPIVAVAVSAVAGVVVFIVLDAVRSFILDKGSGALDPWPGGAFWALMPSVLLALAVWLDLRLLRARAPFWVVVVACFAVVFTAMTVAITTAGRQHDVDMVAAACSPSDVRVLTELSVYAPEWGPPTGDTEGGCSVVVSLPGDSTSAMRSLDKAMTDNLWLAWGSASTLTYTRAELTMTATVEASANGITRVRLTIPISGNPTSGPG
jgi:hypothetical protein